MKKQHEYISLEEIYQIYDSIDVNGEPTVSTARISIDGAEEKVKLIKDSLRDSITLNLNQYKFITVDFDPDSKISYIEALLNQKFTLPKAVYSKKEANNHSNQIMAERLYKMFLKAELDKLKHKSIESVNSDLNKTTEETSNELSQKIWRARISTKKFPHILPTGDQITKNIEHVKEPEYNTEIFTSYRGFQIFEAFRDNEIKKNSIYADYSFLFNRLKEDKFIRNMIHTDFMLFTDKEYGTKFIDNYNQFNNSSTVAKIRAYKRYKEQFQ